MFREGDMKLKKGQQREKDFRRCRELNESMLR